MVSKRMRDCGFIIGCDGPKVPKARRSIRKKSSCKKALDDDKLCAFELLATVAGKLLEESDTSSASSNAAVVVDNHNISGGFRKVARRADQDDQGSSEESGVCTSKNSHKEAAIDAKMGFDVKPVIIHRGENEINKPYSETDGGSPKTGESFGPNVDSRMDRTGPCQDVNRVTSEVLGIADKFSSKHRNDVKVDVRDDDDILSQLSHPCSLETATGSPKYVADSQIRKLITPKKWKSAPKLKDASLGSKRNISVCDHGRFLHNTPFKKRKLFDKSTVMTHDGGISNGSVSNSSEKGIHNANDSLTKPHAGNIVSSSDCQQSSNSTNSRVKLSIKSFIVPELLLEVPESTTVGSLKQAVMDAITTVLGGGLNVGVLLDGKKIRDDTRTLQQTGISDNDNLDDLGFILEPCISTQLPPDPPPLPACQSPKDYVNRSLNSTQELTLIDIPDKVCKDLVPFSSPDLDSKPLSDSKALVPVPENAEPLTAVPMNSKLRSSEMGQRRTRRPFTVSEVEALVHAVEKLGTGRWRDVKLCSFDTAKHRTYVDLKDKWKTLVHTARISPQQRRGEPVPQELLDRVLAAHSYWSQHHSRQQGKHQELQLNQSEKVAALT